MKAQLTEDYMVEQPAINWFKELGYSLTHGSELNPENEDGRYTSTLFLFANTCCE